MAKLSRKGVLDPRLGSSSLQSSARSSSRGPNLASSVAADLHHQDDDELQAYLSSLKGKDASKRHSQTKRRDMDWSKLMESHDDFDDENSEEESELPATSLFLKPTVKEELKPITHGFRTANNSGTGGHSERESETKHKQKFSESYLGYDSSDLSAGTPSSELKASANQAQELENSPTPSYSEPSISESLDLKKNVFSIDELGIAVEEDSTSEEDLLAENLRNTYTIDELENYHPQLSSTLKDKQQPSSSNTQTNTALTKQTLHSPGVDETANKHSGFQFSAANRAKTDTTGFTMQVLDGSGDKSLGEYSDEEFESEVLSASEAVEENIRSVSEASTTGETTSETVESQSKHTTSHIDSTAYGDATVSHSKTESESRSNHSDATSLSLTEHPTSSAADSKYPQLETKSGVKDISVQTDPMLMQYPTGVAPHYGREYLQTTPILPLMVSADALEAVTAYCPSAIALSDMLRAQLTLTRQLIASSRHTAQSLASCIAPNHHYTTLEETRQFMAQNRPRILTKEEAKELVRQEELYM